ncbi:putative transporter mfs2 [Podospora fimiseda]|uniref:Transporter mfs2 n=1 Tax=Podospora fimiseda TaxID=252190 RepID=A0AAN7BLI3_9PEZI|nr:putative transporter mfs2 [Podospora fimiseda]
MATAATTSSSSSFTAKRKPTPDDLESQQSENSNASHWSLLFNPGHLTDAIRNHKYPGQGTVESPYVVDFLVKDASNPMQFAPKKKWTITLIQAFATLAVAFVSTAYTGGIFEVIKYFKVSVTVATLGVSLFVFGFAVGPLLWAPLSEFYGRQIIFFGTYMLLVAFSAGSAGADNIETLIILRFFAGAFGSSPLTNAGGVIADMFNANERGAASGIFSMAPFLGPAIGPIVGGFLGETKGWRWIQGLMAIFTGVLWILGSLYVPETYAPVILRKRAANLSKLTGKVYISKMDLGVTKTKMEQFKTNIYRPWQLLFNEPIVFLTSIYLSLVYGTLYMMFGAFPIVFQINRGWSPGIGGLAFVGIAVGMVFAVMYAFVDNKRYMRVAAENGGSAPPEARLPLAIIGSVFLPIGLFWFAWTNGPEIHWIVPIIASAFFAAGLVGVFLSLLTYMIDSYTVYAASVLAANSVLRSLFGAAFPLFTTYMYQDLGIHWASTVPAFLALACMPFPILFWWYGARIRAKCKYATEAARILEQWKTVHTGEEEEKVETSRPVSHARSGSYPVTEGRTVLSEDETIRGEEEGEEEVKRMKKIKEDEKKVGDAA